MNVKLLCNIAHVSRSGYYKWLKKSEEQEKDYEDYLLIKEIFERSKRKYGFRTIKMKLQNDKKVIINHKKIQRIMKKYHLFTKIRKTNPYKMIMKKTQEHRISDNLLDRNFKQKIPYKIFCTDITYIPYNHRMAYLSIIKDIASREVVGWNLANNLSMPIVLNTIKNMKNNKNLPISSFEKMMIHSDQGFHYTNPEYIKIIKDLKMIQSMSRKGNCIDNAPIESFFGHLKDDVDYRNCKIFEELNSMITEYIDYYNDKRYQWELKKMTPIKYRNHLLNVCM